MLVASDEATCNNDNGNQENNDDNIWKRKRTLDTTRDALSNF